MAKKLLRPKAIPTVTKSKPVQELVAPITKKAAEIAVSRPARNAARNDPEVVRGVRHLAMMEFATDDRRGSVHELWKRREMYHKLFLYETFLNWSKEDEWHTRRVQYWEEVSKRVLLEFADQVAIQRIGEVKDLTDAANAIFEYVAPRKNSDGSWRRYPAGHDLEGMPEYALPPRSHGAAVEAFTKIVDKLLLARGQATQRTEVVGEEGPRRALSEPESGKRQFSSDQIRIMTRAVLESQQPELITDAIDIEPERVETEEDGK